MGLKEQQTILLALQRIEKKVDKLNSQSHLDKDYLSTYEACSYLGCTRSMIWRLVKDGKLNKLKMENGRTYYATQELKNIIESAALQQPAA